MLAMSDTITAVFEQKTDFADQRAEAGAITRGLTMFFQIIVFLRPLGCRPMI
ncbi:hypothetical protein [Bradyrhizobium yuanmingense]|uniref:hypothetical protein n=1 Tax=Bradyrhizobium yuanmingense TaxID=108015 RepID=UPI000A8BE558|nr:hypothetical protein [Bradyrhizobium yuanmingense]